MRCFESASARHPPPGLRHRSSCFPGEWQKLLGPKRRAEWLFRRGSESCRAAFPSVFCKKRSVFGDFRVVRKTGSHFSPQCPSRHPRPVQAARRFCRTMSYGGSKRANCAHRRGRRRHRPPHHPFPGDVIHRAATSRSLPTRPFLLSLAYTFTGATSRMALARSIISICPQSQPTPVGPPQKTTGLFAGSTAPYKSAIIPATIV